MDGRAIFALAVIVAVILIVVSGFWSRNRRSK
jgi:FtsZ-interacting cell division protein ZipA